MTKSISKQPNLHSPTNTAPSQQTSRPSHPQKSSFPDNPRDFQHWIANPQHHHHNFSQAFKPMTLYNAWLFTKHDPLQSMALYKAWLYKKPQPARPSFHPRLTNPTSAPYPSLNNTRLASEFQKAQSLDRQLLQDHATAPHQPCSQQIPSSTRNSASLTHSHCHFFAACYV